MNISDFIEEFEKICAVSGSESEASEYLKNRFSPLFDYIEISPSNSVLGIKKSKSPQAKSILIDAHFDQIGFIVSEIFENGFLKCSPIGGIDPSIIPSRKFVINGKEKISAVASNKPVHLLTEKDKNEKIKIEDVFFDTGRNDVSSLINIGDIVTFSPTFEKIDQDTIISTHLDNMASVATLLKLAEEMDAPRNNLCFLFSSGEETTSVGVKAILHKYKFDYAFILDAGFGYSDGMDEFSTIKVGKGPSVSFADTLDTSFTAHAIDVLTKNHAEFQVIAEPTSTGTNATHVQVSEFGLPSLVVSIPLKNMHTPSEIVKISDIEKTVSAMKLLIDENYSECEVKTVV